jgi:hypothetical protein
MCGICKVGGRGAGGGSTGKIGGDGHESNVGQCKIVEERRDRKTRSKELQSQEEREREVGDRRTGRDTGGRRHDV